jgi:hypothetical protein
LDKIAVQKLYPERSTAMGEVGKKDKGNKEQRKKAKLNPKEKRKLKREKEKNKAVVAHVQIPG